MKTIKDFSELSVTIKQLKRQARRERAKARKQEHAKRMETYKEQSAKCVCINTQPEHIFEICQQKRSAKKFRNNVSNQHAGTCKPYTTVVRSGYTAITIKKR